MSFPNSSLGTCGVKASRGTVANSTCLAVAALAAYVEPFRISSAPTCSLSAKASPAPIDSTMLGVPPSSRDIHIGAGLRRRNERQRPSPEVSGALAPVGKQASPPRSTRLSPGTRSSRAQERDRLARRSRSYGRTLAPPNALVSMHHMSVAAPAGTGTGAFPVVSDVIRRITSETAGRPGADRVRAVEHVWIATLHVGRGLGLRRWRRGCPVSSISALSAALARTRARASMRSRAPGLPRLLRVVPRDHEGEVRIGGTSSQPARAPGAGRLLGSTDRIASRASSDAQPAACGWRLSHKSRAPAPRRAAMGR